MVPEIKDIQEPKTAGVDEAYLDYWLSANHLSLEEFLTNKRYIIIQDGDEYTIWHDLVTSGLIDKNEIICREEGLDD